MDHHKVLVILGVRDLKVLEHWEQKLSDSRSKYEVFTEPDMNEEKTAIAIHPGTDGRIFKTLRLL